MSQTELPPLEFIEIDPEAGADSCIIWMHGLGADGNDFVPIVPELKIPDSLGLRFVFPHAPVRPVTLNGGMPMRAWFDITSLDKEGQPDADGIRASQAQIEALIAQQVARGIPPERIVLAGFSQGGAIALQTGLRHNARLAGIIALSTWLPLFETLDDEASEANAGNSILVCHGEHDPMVECRYGEMSRDRLKHAGYAVEWHRYPMQHQVCIEEIEAIGAWLVTQFSKV